MAVCAKPIGTTGPTPNPEPDDSCFPPSIRVVKPNRAFLYFIQTNGTKR